MARQAQCLKMEIGAEILRIGREFATSVEWLLTGEG
jgi:hypothetical protein